MSFRGEQLNKNNGVTYIYEARSIWNPKKQRSEQKRVYIGKKDPETGELIPNKTYYKLYGDESANDEFKQDEASSKHFEIMSSHDYGNIAIMQHAADDTGLTDTLKECFPDKWEDILACAMHCCSVNAPK